MATSTRPAERKDSIAAYVRDQIVTGVWQPGAQIPKRTELEQQFGAGPVTVQRALDELSEDGFVHATARRGTFVADRPPHLSRFALVFHEAKKYTGPFYAGLVAEAEKRSAIGEHTFAVYYSVDGHVDSPDYVRLTEDVRLNRLAGIIFSTSPFKVERTSLLDSSVIPSVAITKTFGVDGLRAICSFDRTSFLEKALARVAAEGRKRVGIVLPIGFSSEAEATALAEKQGLETRPYWIHCLGHDNVDAARTVTHLMQNPNQIERPDALVIADDKMLGPASAGVIAAGMEVGRDLSLITHCNFPNPVESDLPVTRLGFDLREVLDLCVATIDAQRLGAPFNSQEQIPARFESEIS